VGYKVPVDRPSPPSLVALLVGFFCWATRACVLLGGIPVEANGAYPPSFTLAILLPSQPEKTGMSAAG